MKERIKKIRQIIQEILLEEKCSLSTANWLEVELDEIFPQDGVIQDFVTELALYEPYGGEYLLDESGIIKECKKILEYMGLMDI